MADSVVNDKDNTFMLYDEFAYLKDDHTCLSVVPDVVPAGSEPTPAMNFFSVAVKVGEIKGKAFLDSGCTFNAVSSEFAEKCNLEIVDHDNDIKCAIGGGKNLQIKRRVAKCTFDLLSLGTLETHVFVMDPIPLGCDIIFGLDFLETVNPQIDWKTKTACPKQVEIEHDTPEPNPLQNHYAQEIEHRNLMMRHTIEEFQTTGEPTLVIGPEECELEMKKLWKLGLEHFAL